jgi:hypothetical protein
LEIGTPNYLYIQNRIKSIKGKMSFGYCDYHEEEINEKTFEYKDCWNCYHFKKGHDFLYYDVNEVSEILRVSPSTIRRRIKNGSLKGRLFERQRRLLWVNDPQKNIS